ncbi:hypothetical protein O3G_MSEX009800 [Manduca sexta]|uniref:Uncharacterized protein n=1 Tax=Manduca sexta TaxID=7130 RepID=A0A921ZFC4_MANSE|nr:hypothetical protein O3G_MSEX009800 [Manduca sexta]
MSARAWVFCDLSVSRDFPLDQVHLIKKLGFDTIAINTYVEEPSDEPKKKKKKAEDRKDFLPPPLEIPVEVSSMMNVLQRVTFEYSDANVAHKMNQSENLKKYDIVAVVPKTLQAFQHACASTDIDMISFEPEGRIPFKIHRKMYSQAVNKGIFFEIMYSPAIRDSTSRKNIISNAHLYHVIGDSKNIIITSGAESPMHVRNVHDIINLGFLLGLNSNQSMDVVRNNPRKLILKAESRRCGKHYLVITKNK